MFKKRLMMVLAAVFMMAALLPSTAMAAVTNESAFKAVKLTDVKKYNTKLPTKGKAISAAKLKAQLKKLPSGIPGTGKTVYTETLTFETSSTIKYLRERKVKSWTQTSKGYITKQYSEMQNGSGISYGLSVRSGGISKTYTWLKGGEKGSLIVYPGHIAGLRTEPKMKAIKLYPDAKVLGNACLVYSYQPALSTTDTIVYVYVSRTTGAIVKEVETSISQPANRYVRIVFTEKNVNKTSSFFKPPAGIEFSNPLTLSSFEEADASGYSA